MPWRFSPRRAGLLLPMQRARTRRLYMHLALNPEFFGIYTRTRPVRYKVIFGCGVLLVSLSFI